MFFETGHIYSNFLDSELEKVIEKYSNGNEIAVVLSSGFNLENLYYSTESSDEMSAKPWIKYKGKNYRVEKIAEWMVTKDRSELKQFIPYRMFNSKEETEKGFEFHLLIAGEIKEYKKRGLAKKIDKKWNKDVGYSLNFK